MKRSRCVKVFQQILAQNPNKLIKIQIKTKITIHQMYKNNLKVRYAEKDKSDDSVGIKPTK